MSLVKLIYADRLKVTWTGTGQAGTLTPGAALTAFQAFVDYFGTGSSVPKHLPLCIQAVDAAGAPTGAWETGVWKFVPSSNTLTRVSFFSSSTGGYINWSAGTKHIMCSQVAAEVTRTPSIISADESIYVDTTTGSDYNDGGYVTPLGSIQTAINQIAGKIILEGVTVTISVVGETYYEDLVLKSFAGGGRVLITTGGGTVTIYGSGDAVSNGSSHTGLYELQSVTLTSDGGNGVNIAGPSRVKLSYVEFAACATGAHVKAADHAMLEIASASYITGNAVSHIHASRCATINEAGTVSITGTPAFTQYAYGEDNAALNCVGAAYSGSATGKRYTLVTCATLRRSGGNLPGSTAGTAYTTQYV